MISDRIPAVWDMTLRKCRCRQQWIDRFYRIHVSSFNHNVMKSKKENNKEKSTTIKRLLNPQIQSFEKVTDLYRGDMTDEDFRFWRTVCDWERYFAKNNIYWKNLIDLHKEEPLVDIIKKLSERYRINEDLASFIVKYHYKLWV